MVWSRGWLVALALATLGVAAPALARTVTVKSRYAKVRATPASTAPVLATLAVGQALEVVAEKPGLLQVKLPDGRLGWVSALWVGDPARQGNERLEQIGRSVRQDGGGQVSYTAGARGLAPEARSYADGRGASTGLAAAALERLESRRCDPEVLDAFLRAGRLGDYRQEAP